MPTAPTDCPLCGQPNQCTMARERSATQVPLCWCMGSTPSPDTLARIPPQARGLVCICPRCAAAHNSTESPP